MLRSIALCIAVIFLLLGFNSCTHRAKTPDELIKNLTSAANKGDADSFLSAMTDKSRKALEESFANRVALQEAQDHFQEALNERFGKISPAITVAPADFKSTLRRLKGMEILSRNPGRDGTMELRVKSTIETSEGRTVSQEDTLLAREEGGSWKLAGSSFAPDGPNPAIAERLRRQQGAFADLTKQVRDGRFKDRESALVALAQAASKPRERGPGEVSVAPPANRPTVPTVGRGAKESPTVVERKTTDLADPNIFIRRRQPAKYSEKEK